MTKKIAVKLILMWIQLTYLWEETENMRRGHPTPFQVSSSDFNLLVMSDKIRFIQHVQSLKIYIKVVYTV